MERLFVYGTLKRGFGNHDLLSESRFLGKAVTKDKYALYESGIPFVFKYQPVSRIKGEVYEVSNDTLTNIDALEGHPYWYRREKVPVILEDGREMEAWIYFYPVPEGTLNPSGEYGHGKAHFNSFVEEEL